MAVDTTLIVIIVAVTIAVVCIVLFGVLFAYCRRRLKKGTNIRRRVVEGEEIVKVREPLPPPPPVIDERPEIIQDVIYRPRTPPPPREVVYERRGSWPKREVNPEYVIVRKKHHHGRHRRRPSLEADRHIYKTEIIESSSSSSEDEESARSTTHLRKAVPMPMYPVPVATTFAPVIPPMTNVKWQPYPVNAQQPPMPAALPAQIPAPMETVEQTQGTSKGFDQTFFWRPTQRTNEYGIGGGEVAFNTENY